MTMSTSWLERQTLPPAATGVEKTIVVNVMSETCASTSCAPQVPPVRNTCIGNWKPVPKIVTRVVASFGPVFGDDDWITGVRTRLNVNCCGEVADCCEQRPISRVTTT